MPIFNFTFCCLFFLSFYNLFVPPQKLFLFTFEAGTGSAKVQNSFELLKAPRLWPERDVSQKIFFRVPQLLYRTGHNVGCRNLRRCLAAWSNIKQLVLSRFVVCSYDLAKFRLAVGWGSSGIRSPHLPRKENKWFYLVRQPWEYFYMFPSAHIVRKNEVDCLVGCVMDFGKLCLVPVWTGSKTTAMSRETRLDCLPLTAFLYAVDLCFFWCEAFFCVCVVVSFGHAYTSIFLHLAFPSGTT